MRTWVEKLAKVIEKEGINKETRIGSKIHTNNYSIYLSEFKGNYWIYISELSTSACSSIVIYKDEYDLLNEMSTIALKKTKDYFIKQIENLG